MIKKYRPEKGRSEDGLTSEEMKGMHVSREIIYRIVKNALDEDLGPAGDVTADNLLPEKKKGRGKIIAKEGGVLAGIEVAKSVFELLDSGVIFIQQKNDSYEFREGETLLEMEGSAGALLKGERTALNFLQRMSGIATLSRKFRTLAGDAPVRIVDTRKTTPGLRILEKYSVRCGGCFNHRFGLFDSAMIKDNHIALSGGDIEKAIKKLRSVLPHTMKITCETATPEQALTAARAGADVVMLDNMSIEMIKESVRRIKEEFGEKPPLRPLIEASGGVTEETVAAIAESGVDIISVGKLTHGARALDLSMYIE